MSVPPPALSPWDFGWDALVAIATAILAATTAWVAFTTRAVARATRAEVQSQSRPVLLPAALPGPVCISFTSEAIQLRVANSGKGPAFDIRARLDPPELHPDNWSRGILRQGEDVVLSFREVEGNRLERYELLLDYRDLAGREAATRIVVALVAQPTANALEFTQTYAFLEVEPRLEHLGA